VTSFRLTPLAEADLERMIDHVASQADPDRAEAVLTAILTAAERLAEAPGMGHARADLTTEDVRIWSVFSYLIVYRPDTVPIVIVRVLHGAREPGSLKREIER